MTLHNRALCIIQPGKQKSTDLANAIIAGCPGGGMLSYGVPVEQFPKDHTPVFIGVHPSTIELLRDTKRAKVPFVTVDNGYFKPYKEGGYFRATTNAMQWIASRRGSGVGRDVDCQEIGQARYEALGLEPLRPWLLEDNGGPILLVQQSPLWYQMMGESIDWWTESIVKRLRAYTDREIIVRGKPLKRAAPQPPLEDQIDTASAVIGYSSNVLLKAAMKGVPICTLGYSATSPLGCSTPDSLMLGLKLNPTTRERESVLYALAANQWNEDEMRSGRMWRELTDRYEPLFLTLA